MSDLDSIKNAFLDIYASIVHISEASLLAGQYEQLHPWFEKLDALASLEVDDQEVEKLIRDPELVPAIEYISRVKRINGLRLEIKAAKTIIHSQVPWETVTQFIYYPNYLELSRMETFGGNLAAGDQVAFLGSGPLPLTLIALWIRYKIEGIGIEQSREYADLSRQLITALGLTDHIRIVQGNHFSLPLEQACSLLMIGADAMPKEEIFSYLAQCIEEGTKLSYRIYEKGLRRLLDVQSVFKLPPEFEEYTRIRPDPPVNNTSVFVVKRSSGPSDGIGKTH